MNVLVMLWIAAVSATVSSESVTVDDDVDQCATGNNVCDATTTECNATLAVTDSNASNSWAFVATANENLAITSVAIDSANDVVVVGYRPSTSVTFNSTTTMSGGVSGNTGGLVAKLSSAGALQWVVGLSLYIPGRSAVAVDALRNIFVTGGHDQPSGFLIKLNSSGTVVASYDAFSGHLNGYSVDLDSSGNVYTCGYYTGAPRLLSSNVTLDMPSATFGAFVLKLDTDLTPQWVFTIGQSARAHAVSLAVDSASDTLLVGGHVRGTQAFNATTSVGSGTTVDNAFIAKFSLSGSLQWATSPASGSSGNGASLPIEVAAVALCQDSMYVGGSFTGSVTFDGGSTTTTAPGTHDQGFVLKLDQHGVYQWATTFGSGSTGSGEVTRRIVCDHFGDVYAGGQVIGTGSGAQFNISTNLTRWGSTTENVGFCAKVSGTTGTLQWVERAGATVAAVALNSAGDVVATGTCFPSQSSCRFGTLAPSPVGSSNKGAFVFMLPSTILPSPGYTCECRDGFARLPGDVSNDTSCALVTAGPTGSPTTPWPTAAPTSVPSAPTESPTVDPCRMHTCVFDCTGPCGWTDLDQCVTGEITNAVERATQTGCAHAPSDTPTTSPTNAQASGGAGDGGNDGSSMAVWIGVAVAVVLVLLVAAVVLARRHRKTYLPPRDLWTENNKTFTKVNPVHSDADPREEYLEVVGGATATHSAKTAGRRSSIGADAELLPEAWRSIQAGYFKQEEDFPKLVLSYQSDATGAARSGVGKAWMWAVANGFRAANITSFNGYQIDGGANWQEEWFGVLPACDAVVVMMSESYFKSEACVAELKEACTIGKPMIPIYLEDVDIEAPFLGTSPQQIKTSNFIRPFIRRNRVPPPDQGFFQGDGPDDFQRNMSKLVDVVKDNYLKSSERRIPDAQA